MSLGRIWICSFVTILLVIQVYSAEALTKDQAIQQRLEREEALQQAKQARLTNATSIKYPINVITLEKACQTSSKCPKFSELVPYDTTNQKYVGKLTDEKRLKSPLKTPSVIYKGVKDFVICLDCHPDIYKNAKHIIIVTKLDYTLDSENKVVNNTRYENHDRYVENCNTAKIVWLPGLLNDTIKYLESGCTKTDFSEQIKIIKPYSKLTYDGAWYKHLKFLEEAKKLKGTNCLKSDKC